MKFRIDPRRLALAAALVAPACERRESEPPAPAAPAAAPTNRIATPATVRQNLGLTFARVERRAVGRTLRMPGRFELLPTARREHRVPASGRVDLLVGQYQRVEPGTPLYRLDAPRWRELQESLTLAGADVRLAQAAADSIPPLFAAHEQHHRELERAVTTWTDRVEQLERLKSAGGVNTEQLATANAALAAARADLAETLEKEAELAARRSETSARIEAANARFEVLLAAAAALTRMSRADLVANAEGAPAWRRLETIEMRATEAGVVLEFGVSSGSFTDDNALAIVTVEPERVRFRARGLQSDLLRLTDGLPARVVAPSGGSLAAAEPLRGTLQVAPTADPDRRTVELLVLPEHAAAWARAGVSAFAEITLAGATDDVLAIPLACVVRDGLDPILFRRDPKNQDQVIRIEADLGADDGRWVEIKSGVREGDEIVEAGVYPLLIATSGTITKAGHFHPDGSFHEGDK